MGRTKIFTLPDGTTVDRTCEFAKPDPVIKVTLPDGYSVRFWQQRLTNEEYKKQTLEIREEEKGPFDGSPLRLQCVRCKLEWPTGQMSDWPQGPLCPECDGIESLIEAEVQAAEQGRLCPDCGHPIPDGACWYCETRMTEGQIGR